MTAENLHLGELLDALRKEKGITQKQLADGIGVSAQSMSETLKSKTVKFETMTKICAFLGAKAWQFIAYAETGIPVKYWNNFEQIMLLDDADRNFVLEGIANSLRFIVEKNRKSD